MATADGLIAKARQQGFITSEEITALFGGVDDHYEEIDALCEQLAGLGVALVSAASVQEAMEAVAPEAEPSLPLSERRRFESTDDLYELYMHEIRRIRLLTRGEEQRLGKLIRQAEYARSRLDAERQGDADRERLVEQVRQGEEARRCFVEANLRLVASLAWRYRDQGLPLLDLIQEGNIGLLKAVERWDYRYGYRFSTYATWWIRQAISRALADCGRMIRLPVHVQESLAELERARDQLRAQLKRKPTIEEVADSCGMSKSRVQSLLELPRECSLDSLLCCPDFPLAWDEVRGCYVRQSPCPVREFAIHRQYGLDGADGFELPPCLAKPAVSQQEEGTDGVDYALLGYNKESQDLTTRIAREELRSTILKVLDSLSARQRYVIRLRFGIDREESTLEEIGQTLGLTRERIRQIQAAAITRLKNPIRIRRLRQFRG